MKTKLIVLSSLILLSTGCGKIHNQFNRWSSGLVVGNYVVNVYACSDKPVETYHITNGFVNTEEKTDGYYFTDDLGKLIHVSGNVTVRQE